MRQLKTVLGATALLAIVSGCGESTPPLSTSQVKLNDTGIRWGGNYPKGINDTCTAAINVEILPEGESVSGDILAQQDCLHGRDALLKDDRDGLGGLSYQKISAEGKPRPHDAAEWACVRDTVSGLMWEVKKPIDGIKGNAGLHDGDDRFTWYSGNTKTNGGAIGDWNQRYNQCAGYQANQPASYCNTDEFISRVNNESLCGHSDWRIPTRPELETLVYFGQSQPAIDTQFFPNTKNEFYWSSSPVAGHSTSAWAVSFQFGFTAPLQRNNSRFIRLVRTTKKEQ
ncbi:Lcl C-terminal domain-containing protein [Teredinibacter franksiae]|uniref:Lcl C-terminal domain-containing protein n=1 Tax=Teredinibacter franksiae TaxID=2761453 RepID=UPI00162A0894|nr:DUF1566 domain-containing protein [Teredinibacter franksiae]